MTAIGPTGLYFMTSVWGEAYTRLLLDVVIPAQLAPGNLPGLQDADRCRYLIYTTSSDAEVIAAAPVYRALSNLIPAQIELIEDEIKVPHDTMSNCFRRGISLADDRGAASVFLTPDLVFSDGAFRRLQTLASEGWRVVYIAGIRLVKQGAARALQEKFMTADVIAIGSRDLMAIALQHLHPLAKSSFWEEGEGDLVPANLYWRAGPEGILARCFHLHPVLVCPERKHAIFFGTVDDDYVPAACPDAAADYVSRDSDEILAVELSDPSHFFLTGLRKGSLNDVAYWAEMAANVRHRTLLSVPIRLHTGAVDDEAWRAVGRKSDEVVAGIESLLGRSAIRLLLSNSPYLERRLFRMALDKRLQLVNQTRRVEALNAGRRLDEPMLRAPLETRHALLRIGMAHIRLLEACAARVEQIDVKARFIHALLFAFGAYARALPWWSRVLARIRETVSGPPTSPNVLNMSWLYMRQLSRDFREAAADLGPEPVVCGDDGEYSIARMASTLGGPRAALVIARDGTAELVDAATGIPLPDSSVRSIVIDATLQRCDDLKAIVVEVVRVLKSGGRMAMRIDRLPGSRNPTGEVYVSAPAVCEALRSSFEVIGDRRQGGIGTVLIMLLRIYRKQRASRVRIPYILWFFAVLVMMPAEIMAVMILNVLGLILDGLDTRRRNYVSSIIDARKGEATANGEPDQGGSSPAHRTGVGSDHYGERRPNGKE